MEKISKRLILALMVLMLVFLWTSCKKGEDANKKTAKQTITVSLQPSSTSLFYTGTIQPVHSETVESPVDGAVSKMYFRYGDTIAQGQRLFSLVSSKAEEDYHTALTDYLKAKDEYLRNKASFEGTTALYNAKIVDREDYLNEKSVLEASQLAYITAEQTLKGVVEKLPGKPVDFQKLSLQDINTVKKILEQQTNMIDIFAPISGVALFTAKTEQDASGGGEKPVNVGSEVKEGQTLVSIGRVLGISVVVYVNESIVNKIKPGQEVTVTTSAVPGLTLKGRVVQVAAQAKAAEGGAAPGGLPTFPVSIIVYNMTPQQRNQLKIGMSAKVEIIIKNPPQIKIPLGAVFEKNGLTMVTVVDSRTGAARDVPVQTGETSLSQVTILSGLKAGDKIQIHD